MNKEAVTYFQERSKLNEPKDVKIARFSSKLDIIQIGAGGVAAGVGVIIGAPFLIPLGLGYVAFNGVEYVGTKAYIKYRLDHDKKKQAAAGKTLSNVIPFRQSERKSLPQAA